MAKPVERVGRELSMRELEAIRGGARRQPSPREQAMLRRRWMSPLAEQEEREGARRRKGA